MDVRLRKGMDITERRELVLELLERQGEVSVSEFSKQSEVSAMTVRRDLEVLEQDGILLRVHGGAISLASRGYAPPFTVRANREVEAKKRIGKAAAAMLAERETVILDTGTTALAVANALQERRNLTVLTPSLHIANVLSRSRGIRLMLTGGTVAPGELSMVGDQAEDAFSRLRFDTFVMGVGGIEVEAGCTEFVLDDARVKRAALATVKRCIVVADSSKLSKVTFAQVCALDRVDVLVTDRGASDEDLDALEAAHVEAVVV
jgi:DeoR/GlpR family transcriptional regulator of sugar metabolism